MFLNKSCIINQFYFKFYKINEIFSGFVLIGIRDANLCAFNQHMNHESRTLYQQYKQR